MNMATSPIALHWNLTTPEAVDGKAKTYPMSALPTLDNEYFHITDNYIEFWAPVAGQPTTKSTKTRTELREYRSDGSGEQNWLGTGGNHSIGASFTVLQMPVSPPLANNRSAFVGQIHVEGGDNPLLKFKYKSNGTTGSMIVSFRADPDPLTATSDTTLFPSVAAGARIQYYAKVSPAGLLTGYVEVSGVREPFSYDLATWLADDPSTTFYFKAGVYNNAEATTTTPADDGSRVRFYKLTTTHA